MWNRLSLPGRRWIIGTALAAAGVVTWGPLQASCARSMLSAARDGNVDAFHHGVPPLSRSAAAVFAEGLGDRDARVRSAAANGLCILGGLSKAHVAELMTVAASDNDEEVRMWAVTALGCIPAKPTDAEPLLRSFLAYEPGGVNDLGAPRGWLIRSRAAWALGEVHGCSPDTVDALRATLNASEALYEKLPNEHFTDHLIAQSAKEALAACGEHSRAVEQ